MAERTEYVVAVDESSRASIDAGCHAVLRMVMPLSTTATLDGYIGWPDPPPHILAIYQAFVDEHGESDLMALPFDLSHEESRNVFLTFAPWSIQAELADDTGTVLASFDDGGTAVVPRLTADETALLRQQLGEVGFPEIEVVAGDEWDTRRRLEKRAARADAVKRIIDRLRR